MSGIPPGRLREAIESSLWQDICYWAGVPLDHPATGDGINQRQVENLELLDLSLDLAFLAHSSSCSNVTRTPSLASAHASNNDVD